MELLHFTGFGWWNFKQAKKQQHDFKQAKQQHDFKPAKQQHELIEGFDWFYFWY
jgi:hypothetical protein